MSQIIRATATSLEGEDFTWMVGRSISDVSHAEPYSWYFTFSEGGQCSVDGGTWRLTSPEAPMTSSEDHGHVFGRPEALDARAAALAAVRDRRVVRVSVRSTAPDLVIELDGGVVLEILALSVAYECWQVCDPAGRCVVVSGSRHASTWNQ
jgi:hypothetical protein